MSDFINTVDELGEDVLLKNIINKSIVSFWSNHITYMRNNAFYNCHMLQSVNLPNATFYAGSSIGYTNQESLFANCWSLNEVTLPNIRQIPEYCFANCFSLTSFHLPSSISTLGAGAFCGAKNLRQITADEGISISNIPSTLFYKAEKLETIPWDIFKDIDWINMGAFSYTKLLIPTSFFENIVPNAYIASGAFKNANIPDEITLGKKVVDGETVITTNKYREKIFENSGHILYDWIPSITNTNHGYCASSSRFETICLPNISSIACGNSNKDGFAGASFLKNLVIGTNESTEVVPLSYSATSVFQYTPIVRSDRGIGRVYVADNLVDEYKNATNWSTIADRIFPLSTFSKTNEYDNEYVQESWENISLNIKNNNYQQYYGKKKLTILPHYGWINMVCVATDVDEKEDGQTANTTWVCEDIIGSVRSRFGVNQARHYPNENQDSTKAYQETSYLRIEPYHICSNYEESELRDDMMLIYNDLEASLKDNIVSVKKYSSGYDENSQKTDTITYEKVWSLSAKELSGSTSYETNGAQYSLYSSLPSSRPKYGSNASSRGTPGIGGFYLRTVSLNGSHYYNVNTSISNGIAHELQYDDYQFSVTSTSAPFLGFVFGFCL